MAKNQLKKSILKSQKHISILAGALVALALGTGIFFSSNEIINRIDTLDTDTGIEMVEKSGVDLTSNSDAKKLAENLGVLDMLAQDDNGNIIRFEALQNKPIDIIVDENSMGEMTENVKDGIRLAINQYNELFSYINPEYSFRYVSKGQYDKNPSSDPFIFITTNLRINANGGYARAVTSPAEPEVSSYNNGMVDSSSIIIISSTGTINLTNKEIANVVMHEMAHALGIKEHSMNKESMMHSSSDGVTIASNYFSEDLLNAMLSCYYNHKTNSKSNEEITDYINNHIVNRNAEIQSYYNIQQEAIEQSDMKTYINNIKNYASKNGLSAGNIKNIIGASYSSTNVYGQTTTFSFNEDGTYILEISSEGKFLQCKGQYEIVNNVAVLKGQYYKVKNNQYVHNEDTIYLSVFSDGNCAYSTKSGNLLIKDVLSRVLENEYSH